MFKMINGIIDKINTYRCPYSKYENEYKSIFVHIPKNGGNSISKSLFNKRSTGHNFLVRYEEYDKNKYNNYFKFCVVRNPWDRIVSAYFFLRQGGLWLGDKLWAKENLKNYENFDEFVIALQKPTIRNNVLSWIHFIPQHKFILNSKGKVDIDYIARLENINHDFKEICKIIGKKRCKLIQSNKSKHKYYKNYYTTETKEIVNEIYSKDIELFGYAF